MLDKTPRLKFTEEELETPAVAHAARKAERAADKADAAKARLPTKSKLKHESDKAANRKEQLRFGKKEKSKTADGQKKPAGQPARAKKNPALMAAPAKQA